MKGVYTDIHTYIYRYVHIYIHDPLQQTQLRSTCTLAAVLGNPFGTAVLRTGQLSGRRRANAHAGGLLQPMNPQFKWDENNLILLHLG